jgi:hypothetical protein
MTTQTPTQPDQTTSKGCYRPIRLRQINLSTGEIPEGARAIYSRCGTRHETKCASCAEIYRRDAITLIEKGVPKRRRKGHHLLFVTLTAPGSEYFGSANHRQTGQFTGVCPCGTAHPQDDELLGAPIDFDKFDYDLAVRWNNSLPELWRRFIIALERTFPDQRIEYVKVVEVQRRGLFHIHTILRIEPTKNSGIIYDRESVKVGVIKAVRIPNVSGHKFGKQVDIKFARQNPPKKRKNETQADYQKRVRQSLTRNTFARYLAKYATKGSDHAKRKGKIGKYVVAHQVKLKQAALPYAESWKKARLVEWRETQRLLPKEDRANPMYKSKAEIVYETRANSMVQAFGFSGQFLTKSAKYSTTFKKIREKAKKVAQEKAQKLYGAIKDEYQWFVEGFGLIVEHRDYVMNYWKEHLKSRGYEPPDFSVA